MTMSGRSMSNYIGAVLVLGGAGLAAWNWVLRPDRAFAWGSALALFGCMAAALALTWRRPADDSAGSRAAGSIQSGIVFAGLIMLASLVGALATARGALHDADFARRASMVVVGMFFAATGNAMPKMLTPLSRMRCDPARVQAFQRLSGWIWVLAGLGYALAWVVLPLPLADSVSLAVIVSAMLLIIWQLVRLRRAPTQEA